MMAATPSSSLPAPGAAFEEITNMSSAELMKLLNTDDLCSLLDTGSVPNSGNTSGVSGMVVSEGAPSNPVSAAQPPLPNNISVAPRTKDPYIEIIEQPKSRGLRFRYQCEGRSAGSIAGESSTANKKTAPTIKIVNYEGPFIVVVSCVTNETRPKPHPHSLVGTDCTKGVCTVKIKDKTTVSFNHLGIQCARKKDIEEALSVRREINVDPYQMGFDYNKGSIDLNTVKLCYQAFLPDSKGKFSRILLPVCSQAIYDRKVQNDLTICRLDKVSGSAHGWDEIFMLCDKIVKDDIKIRFQELNSQNEVVWEAYGEFGVADVHKQYAIVFKSPPYMNANITKSVDVIIQLVRPSDESASKGINFKYVPNNSDPFHMIEKKKRKSQLYEPLIQQTLPNQSLSVDVKERLRAKAARKIKTEYDLNIPVATLPHILQEPTSTVTSAQFNISANNNHFLLSNNNIFTTTALPPGDSNIFSGLSWLNPVMTNDDNLRMPTQVSTVDANDARHIPTYADLTDIFNDRLLHEPINPFDGNVQLAGDILMSSNDPTISGVENISSES